MNGDIFKMRETPKVHVTYSIGENHGRTRLIAVNNSKNTWNVLYNGQSAGKFPHLGKSSTTLWRWVETICFSIR